MTTMAKAIRVKDTAFGQDMLEVLAERQLERIGYQELDIAHSIQTLKEYLVKKLSHGNWRVDPGLCQPELRYLYPVYFDSARVLLAECVAEFFQTGKRDFLRGSRQALSPPCLLQRIPSEKRRWTAAELKLAPTKSFLRRQRKSA